MHEMGDFALCKVQNSKRLCHVILPAIPKQE